MSICNQCPRQCNIERSKQQGFCGMPEMPVVARAGVHLWEEPCISGEHGSGTVFFSGCNLGCVFCQNYAISSEKFGKEITVQRLREIYQDLIQQGVHNINLVNPSHYPQVIAESLSPQPPLPVVYNSSGYDDVAALKTLAGKVQIYLPDLKYSLDNIAWKYSRTQDYFSVATKAIKEMYRQVGNYCLDEQGIMESGVLIRHLVLPNNIENSLRVIDWVTDNFQAGQVMLSLMGQYLPYGKACQYPEINRRLTEDEYNTVMNYLFERNFDDGYVQELSAAEDAYIPSFDLSGV